MQHLILKKRYSRDIKARVLRGMHLSLSDRCLCVFDTHVTVMACRPLV